MKVLITGAGGFIGSRVISRLKDIDIIALSSSSIEGIQTIDCKGYEFDENYLMSHGCEDVEAIIHLGAFIPKDSSFVNDVEATTSNILSTQHIGLSNLPALKKFIYISSIDVYGNNDGVITEETQPEPISMYGWSKLYCEKMLKSIFQGSKVDYQILRLGHVFGEGEEKYKKVIPVMIRKALQNEEIIIYGDGQATRAFIYVDDVVSAIERSLIQNGLGVTNLVGEREISINQLSQLIIDYSGSKSVISHQKSDVSNRICKFDYSKCKTNLLNEYSSFETELYKEIDYMKHRLNSEKV